MSAHYPSRQQVLEKIQPELDWIQKHTIYAEYDAPSTPTIKYHEVVGEKRDANTSVRSSASNGVARESTLLLEDHYHFMAEIQKHPTDGLKRHYDHLKLGIEKGNRILRELKTIGHVVVREVKSTSPKGGRSRLVVALTEKGNAFLNAYDNRNAGSLSKQD